MPEQNTEMPQQETSSAPARNPYIMNFCKVLVEKKGEEHQPEGLEKLLGDMYRLFESMLGQNMVNALPEEARKEYLDMAKDLRNLDYDKIGTIFNVHVLDYEVVMKETMKQFAQIYLSNRQFSPEQYPVKLEEI
jgi:hypothetical protein